VTPWYSGEPVARTLYQLVIYLWLASEVFHALGVVARAIREKRGFSGVGQDRLSGPALVVGILLAVAVGYRAARYVPQAAITVFQPEIFAVGLGLALAGIVLRAYAIVRLGRFFNTRVTVVADQVVIDTGPYRLVRHPSYSGALLTLFGILLCSTNWFTLACFLLAAPGFAYRIAVEERALVNGLGQPYRDYMGRTKRLIPYVL
jgi:protein-S-isoprenylcysteine O-methyltransferase Ste14